MPRTDDQPIFDVLANTQELYERYLELSRIADITPDSAEEAVPYRPPPIGLHVHGRPTVLLVDQL